MKLNLGCGSQVLDGWVNVDYALGARFTKMPLFKSINKRTGLFNLDWNEKIFIHNLTKPFPWADNSADAAYSSHTLEHLSKEAGRAFLAECHRVLRRDGVIRIVVPDLSCMVADYTEGRVRADDFVESLGVLYGNRGGLKQRLAPFIEFPHRCMYDTPTLIDVLDDIGFDAEARAPFDSGIEDIRVIELEDRTVRAVVVEGRKR